MRFISYRRKYIKGWIVFCIVKKWRPIYARWNERFARAENLAEWIILDEETFTRWWREGRLNAVDKERLHELHSS